MFEAGQRADSSESAYALSTARSLAPIRRSPDPSIRSPADAPKAIRPAVQMSRQAHAGGRPTIDR